MKFTPIGDEMKVYPGEYVYHTPSSAIVIVGSFNRDKDMIRGMREGKLFEDRIGSFQKINLTRTENARFRHARGCSGCKGR